MVNPTGDQGVLTHCTGTADCDDGLYCTGVERCDPSNAAADADGCVTDAPPCVASLCDESQDTCDSECVDQDGDGHLGVACGGSDCDDTDSRRFAEATEVCDLEGVDEDCNPCTVGVRDNDGDFFIDARCVNTFDAAAPPACGFDVSVSEDPARVRGIDCEDNDPNIKPGQAETCNGKDDDCDGNIDENLTLVTFWPDTDGDGYGDASVSPIEACAQPDGYVTRGGDCDDNNINVRPGAAELCDGIDNNCSGEADEATASNTFYFDQDEDGVGDTSAPVTVVSCTPPAGYVSAQGDCKDNDPNIFPGAVERCDRVDNNCSLVGDRGGVDVSEDKDNDGHAPIGATCVSTVSGSFPADDCDDNNRLNHPGMPEICDGIDNNCNMQLDENVDSQCASDAICDAGCVTTNRLALASDQACATTLSGSVACWGDSGPSVTHWSIFGSLGAAQKVSDPVAIAGLSSVRQVVLADQHACALIMDRTVRCWGSNERGRLGLGHSAPVGGIVAPVGLANVVALVAGAGHTCALRGDGRVACWGDQNPLLYGASGALGQGDFSDRNVPTLVPNLVGIVELRGQDEQVCARDFQNEVYCWGRGDLGDGTSIANAPHHVTNLSGTEELHMGGSADFYTPVCARVGTVWSCWGTGPSAGTGGSYSSVPLPLTAVASADVARLALGAAHSCALLTSGQVDCWGAGANGVAASTSELAADVLTGIRVPAAAGAVSLSCAKDVCCSLDSSDALLCWGNPGHPVQQGIRDPEVLNTVPGLVAPRSIVSGAEHACALDDEGLKCWGANLHGQLGLGDELERYAPTLLPISDVAQVRSHRNRTCLRTVAGAVWCAGEGFVGDTDDTADSPSFVQVDFPNGVVPKEVVVTAFGACALDGSNQVWCWGGEVEPWQDGPESLMCGNGTSSCRTPSLVSLVSMNLVDPVEPIAPMDLTPLIAQELGAGANHVCARTAAGEVFCWGDGSSGQLGDGAWETSLRPVQFGGSMGFTSAVQLAVSSYNTCVRASDHTVRCVGSGSLGQLGAGASIRTPQHLPVTVVNLTDAQRVVCGASSCLAQKPNGTWVGWGGNTNGGLGDGTRSDRFAPVPAAFGLAMTGLSCSSGGTCALSPTGAPVCWGARYRYNAPPALPAFSVTSDMTLP